ncbi:MAG: helix-turn-helix transcriptional regulator [Bacteroidetes bacterium]|nr:helix-turn-helix transcriptional regulator [Bacteroidota bacterium]
MISHYSKTLNHLVKDQFTIRTAFAETPPRVAYTLSSEGKELIPKLKDIARWGHYLIEKYLTFFAYS